jgi:hypothetical protein
MFDDRFNESLSGALQELVELLSPNLHGLSLIDVSCLR